VPHFPQIARQTSYFFFIMWIFAGFPLENGFILSYNVLS